MEEGVDHMDLLEPLEACTQARQLWFANGCLEKVENLYESVWKRPIPVSERRQAGEKLALLYLQSNRPQQADAILKELDYTWKLSSMVLNYHLSGKKSKASDLPVPCHILDSYLTPTEQDVLWQTFSPDSSFWKDHDYAVEPPSPYSSYVIEIQDQGKSFLQRFLHRLRSTVAHYHPSLADCTCTELWAHCRPHASGHQLHFDTDNEGCDQELQHPAVTCLLYLTEGAPSLVTQQRVTSSRLAMQGWLCPAQAQRLVIMKGRVLHGVIPGRGQGNTRVSLMVAFWKKPIRIRPSGTPGAARPWPKGAAWAQALDSSANESVDLASQSREVAPILVQPVFEPIGSMDPNVMPEYSRVFQGI